LVNPLRVLHVAPYCGDAWAYGGIPRVVDALTAGFAARGHDVTLCTTDACEVSSRLDARPRAWGAWQPSRGRGGVLRRVFPNISNRAAYRAQLFMPLGLAGFLRQHSRDFDVAHLHACRNIPGVIAAHYLRATGIPYVIAPNGTAPNIERRHVAKRLFDVAFGRCVLAGAARVIAVSEAERRQLRALDVGDDRIRTIPNPLDLDELSAPPRRGLFRSSSIPVDAPIVLFIGKLTPRKRLDVLIRAFDRVCTSHARGAIARLVIAGNDMGSEAAARSLVRQLGLEGHTIFTGLLPGRRRLEALVDADMVVYPSEDEIFGLVPLEALLMGTPVIVTGDSGCGEVVTRVAGGQVVPVGDDRALALAIQGVLDDPDRWHRTADQAATRVRESYGRDVVCAALEETYVELMQEHALARQRSTKARIAGGPAVQGAGE
jgi:glycosyltransferase involved in cell wall biosynthesis